MQEDGRRPDIMNSYDFSTSFIVLASWRAAKDELHSAMLAACQTFMNRANANGTDVYDEAISYLEINTDGWPDVRDPQFQALVGKINSVLDGQIPDRTGGALWFANKSVLSRSPNLLEPYTITATLGNMVFVK